MTISKYYYDSIYLEGRVIEGIPKCERKACSDIIEIWTEIANNLRVSLDNIMGDTQQAKSQCSEFHAKPYGTKIYFTSSVLTRCNCFSLHQSIYLS